MDYEENMKQTRPQFEQTELMQIPEDWEVVELGFIAEFKNGKTSPHRNDSFETPVYGANGVIGRSQITNTDENTIIIGRVGAYCGSLYFSENKCWVTDNAIIGKAKDKSDDKFLYYLLQTLDLNNRQGGSGQPLLNQSLLNTIKVLCPKSKMEQKKIAEGLGLLDKKIQLNRKMNKTLEYIGQATFKKWFIEQENGRQGIINDFAGIKGGTTPKTNIPKYWDGDINWATPRDLSVSKSPVLFKTGRKITNEGLKTISSGLLPINTLLLSSRAPIGYLAFTNIPVAINQGFIAINARSNYYMYYWLKNNMKTVIGSANGSTFLEISKSNFRQIKMLIPNDEILLKFDSLVKNLVNQIIANEKEIETLSQIRDSLLPKLMSGKIRVR